jgi:hypothetical protein
MTLVSPLELGRILAWVPDISDYWVVAKVAQVASLFPTVPKSGKLPPEG